MRKKVISKIVCPKCKSRLKLKKIKQRKDRIIEGKLICKKCNAIFEIIDKIVCFRIITKKDRNKLKIKKIRDLFLKQELKKEWFKYLNKQELFSLKKEWTWMINELNLKESKLHLEWAVGTGRFLRNIIDKIHREIVVIEIDYPTCVGLQTFLKKIKKYSKVTIICGNANKMPFSDNSFESISSWHGIGEPDISKAIKESKRVLKLNKRLVLSGSLYEKKSKSLQIAKRYKIKFTEEGKIYQYFRKKGFRDINYKTFFKGKWLIRKSFLPCFGDNYTIYAISGKK